MEHSENENCLCAYDMNQLFAPRLGKEVPITTPNKASVTIIRKLASFRFKYRPLGEPRFMTPSLISIGCSFLVADVLKADGIIPQDQPTPLKRQADPEDTIDLTEEDDCQRCQCGAKPRKKAKVTKSIVKTEVKKETFGDVEVLDLTIW